ncbi:hypothetical protein AB0O52_18345 [Arthrobacter sp. NPDC080073]|uniref:hypothetical protein n=1 Tax=Arthrobacter sp. NPDC080073 TaxID=3155919 RepID=UPI003434BCD7
MRPHTLEDDTCVAKLLHSLQGNQLTRVTYVYPDGWAITDETESHHIHEVGMDIILHFAGRKHLKISWAMAGLVEGLELSRHELARDGLTQVDVSASPSWTRLLGQEIYETKALWRSANTDAAQSIWWTKFSLNSGDSFSVTLGEMEDGIPDYKPNSLLVFFNEVQDRAFRKQSGRDWN